MTNPTPHRDLDFESCKAGFLADEVDFLHVLTHEDSRARAFVVNLLRGRHGAELARSVGEVITCGVGYGGDIDYNQPIADHLLMQDCLPMLKTIVMAGMPAALCEDLWKDRPAPSTRIEWLDLLSTSSYGPPADEDEKSCLAFAAWRLSIANTPEKVATNSDAIQFIWELDPKHADFERLAAEPTAAGAGIRHFLMTKQLQSGASNDAGAQPVVQRLRAHRAKV